MDATRREHCRTDLAGFLRSYFPRQHVSPFSDGQRQFVLAVQSAILNGEGLSAAVPRGQGSTTILGLSAVWSGMYVHHGVGVVIQPSWAMADYLVKWLRPTIALADTLADDFPDASPTPSGPTEIRFGNGSVICFASSIGRAKRTVSRLLDEHDRLPSLAILDNVPTLGGDRDDSDSLLTILRNLPTLRSLISVEGIDSAAASVQA